MDNSGNERQGDRLADKPGAGKIGLAAVVTILRLVRAVMGGFEAGIAWCWTRSMRSIGDLPAARKQREGLRD
ncbi:hypothetical protein C2U68_02060 [Methylomonas koyamae]|nr:hypothetical protein C2U68_02060 [Methylomonas koyamae]